MNKRLRVSVIVIGGALVAIIFTVSRFDLLGRRTREAHVPDERPATHGSATNDSEGSTAPPLRTVVFPVGGIRGDKGTLHRFGSLHVRRWEDKIPRVAKWEELAAASGAVEVPAGRCLAGVIGAPRRAAVRGQRPAKPGGSHSPADGTRQTKSAGSTRPAGLAVDDAVRYYAAMIVSFKCTDTEALANGQRVGRFVNIESVARRKLRQMEIAGRLDDLRIPPGNRLEAIKGDRAGQHSIRVNDQFRVCFRWTGAGAEDVEIVDYH